MMKKNQNIKVRPAYGALALAALVGVVGGCIKYEHKNEIVDVKRDGCRSVVQLRDVNDNHERYFITGYSNYEKFRHFVGDTVSIMVGGLLNDNYYTDSDILYSKGGDCRIKYNVDSLWTRQRRAEEYRLKQHLSKIK